MKKMLLTGGTGFIGRNILPDLKEKYEVYSPSRKDLNLLDDIALREYLKENKFDIIVHTAIPNPSFNSLDKNEKLCEDSMRVFMNFYSLQEYYDKMIYFGSGAEYDKTMDIKSIKENEFGRSIPKDGYGLAKYMMNVISQESDKIFNLRIFGCYGPTDADFKFITNMIHDCKTNNKLSIRQNCYFDFMYVKDIVQVLNEFIEKEPKYHDYNLCTGKRYSLLEIADIIKKEMKSSLPIEIINKNFNKEYTGDNTRLHNEFATLKFTPLLKGIQIMIQSLEEESNEN